MEALSLKILPLRNLYFVDYYKIKFNLLQFFCKIDGRVGPLHKVFSTTALSISVGIEIWTHWWPIDGWKLCLALFEPLFRSLSSANFEIVILENGSTIREEKNPYMGNSGHLVYSVSSCCFFFNIMLLNLDLTNRSNPTGMMDKSLQVFLFWILIQCFWVSVFVSCSCF